MGEKTNIPWCHSTFNPWIGCTKISEACTNCYAETWGKRFGYKWGPGQPRHRTSASTWKQPLRWNRQAEIKFKAWEQFKKQHPGLTDAQLQEQGFVKPVRRRVFCGSLCDVFDNEVPAQWRADLFDLIADTPYLTWLILTKRIGNARAMIPDAFADRPFNSDWPWPNVWIGATVCNQEEADRDIPKLLAVPAAKRFLSIEPMLGPIDLSRYHIGWWCCHNCRQARDPGEDEPLGSDVYCRNCDATSTLEIDGHHLHWVICGGETGPRARPMHPAWVRSLRDQCVAAGVPFFFKQNGEWLLLDGRIWQEVPA
jgi:protein gp37